MSSLLPVRPVGKTGQTGPPRVFAVLIVLAHSGVLGAILCQHVQRWKNHDVLSGYSLVQISVHKKDFDVDGCL